MSISRVRNVLICDGVDPICADILKKNGVNVTCQAKFTFEKLIKEVEKYDALIVRSATNVTEEIIDAGSNLKLICRAGTGVDNIDCEAATRRGVIVMNAPGGNTLSAAEHTCAMICCLARKIPQACMSTKQGRWDRKLFMGCELNGKTLAILGLGRIGREVAARMQSFGMCTVGYDPMIPASVTKKFGVESLSLEEIWPIADFITVHTPLIPQTKDLLNDEIFAKCRDGVQVVNCARGGILNEDALLRALKSGKCAGAGLDVYSQEPPMNRELLEHQNVVCTPHLGASTKEAQKRVAEEIAVQILDLIGNKGFNGLVNAPTLNQVFLDENKPWVELCRCFGILAKALSGGNYDVNMQIKIQTFGQLSEKRPTFFSTALLVGFLKSSSKNGVNVINAPIAAQDAGIKVAVIQNNGPFPHQLPDTNSDGATVVISCGKRVFHLSGTVIGQFPVLCSLDGYDFNNPGLVMRGHVTLFKSKKYLNVVMDFLGELKKKKVSVSAICPSASIADDTWCAICCTDNPSVSSDVTNDELSFMEHIFF